MQNDRYRRKLLNTNTKVILEDCYQFLEFHMLETIPYMNVECKKMHAYIFKRLIELGTTITENTRVRETRLMYKTSLQVSR